MSISKVIALGLLLNATAGFAAEPIQGFAKYRFGMPFEDIANMLTLSEEEASSELTRVFGAKEPVTVLGEDYNITFTFTDDQLSVIHLSRDYVANSIQCISDFDRAFSAIQARYGNPDSAPDKTSPVFMLVRFTAPDGSAVGVTGVSFDQIEKCMVIVAYIGPKPGSSF